MLQPRVLHTIVHNALRTALYIGTDPVLKLMGCVVLAPLQMAAGFEPETLKDGLRIIPIRVGGGK